MVFSRADSGAAAAAAPLPELRREEGPRARAAGEDAGETAAADASRE